MHPAPEHRSAVLDPASEVSLRQTRSAVLNVLVAVGLTIAVSGWLLRGREVGERTGSKQVVHRVLLGGLIVLGVISYATRRVLGRRGALADPQERHARFFRSHLFSAGIASLAAPLGLVYGWFVTPTLGAVLPF